MCLKQSFCLTLSAKRCLCFLGVQSAHEMCCCHSCYSSCLHLARSEPWCRCALDNAGFCLLYEGTDVLHDFPCCYPCADACACRAVLERGTLKVASRCRGSGSRPGRMKPIAPSELSAINGRWSKSQIAGTFFTSSRYSAMRVVLAHMS